jgi:hypothetical protein
MNVNVKEEQKKQIALRKLQEQDANLYTRLKQLAD